MQAGFESIDLLQESEELLPHACWGLLPILSWDAESLRQGCGVKQKQIAHDAVSSYRVSIISTTQRMARQQKMLAAALSTRCRPRDQLRTF
jgi:hypothetical protein